MTEKKVLDYVEFSKTLTSQIHREHKHVSLIFRKNKLIAVGTNDGKTHTQTIKLGYYSPIPHSELAAFIKVPYSLRDKLVLVNFRFNKYGDMRQSKPCHKCLPWCSHLFDEIWHSTDMQMVRMK